MPNERGPAEPITEVLRRFLDSQGLATRVEQVTVLDEWPALVGPAVAAVTRPLSVAADGTLFVAVDTSAWMNELAMMEREILASINRRRGEAPILRLRWQLAR